MTIPSRAVRLLVAACALLLAGGCSGAAPGGRHADLLDLLLAQVLALALRGAFVFLLPG